MTRIYVATSNTAEWTFYGEVSKANLRSELAHIKSCGLYVKIGRAA